MANYSNQGSEPLNVNTMFLKFYLDTMFKMTETFENKNVAAFELYAYYLRACVPVDERREFVDKETQVLQKKIDDGVFGELEESQKKFIRGFAIVTACMKFLDSALRITMHDGTALADITDDKLKAQVEKMMLYKIVGKTIKSKIKRGEIEKQIFEGIITTPEEIDLAISGDLNDADHPEMIMQDDPHTQADADLSPDMQV